MPEKLETLNMLSFIFYKKRSSEPHPLMTLTMFQK